MLKLSWKNARSGLTFLDVPAGQIPDVQKPITSGMAMAHQDQVAVAEDRRHAVVLHRNNNGSHGTQAARLARTQAPPPWLRSPGLYINLDILLYNSGMEVAVSELRANLSEWVARAKTGTEVLVTERGVAVARLTGLSGSSTIDRLVEQGLISRPAKPGARPVATGRSRPRSKGSLSDQISEQRR